MRGEDDRAKVRSEVRRSLRMLFPEVFVAFALLLNPAIGGAVEQEMVTLQEIGVWLDVLFQEGEDHGPSFV